MRFLPILFVACLFSPWSVQGTASLPTEQEVATLFAVASNDVLTLHRSLPPVLSRILNLRKCADTNRVRAIELDLARKVLSLSVATNATLGFDRTLSMSEDLAFWVIGSYGDRRFRPEYAMMIAENLGRYPKFTTNDLMSVVRAAQQSDIKNHRVVQLSPGHRYPSVRPAVANYRRLVRFNQDIGYYRRGFAEWFAESVNDYRNTLPPAAAVSFTNDFIRAAKLTPEEIKVWFPPQGTNDFLNARE